MKTIAIVVDKSDKLANLLKLNLEKVLGGFVDIRLYYLKKFEKSQHLNEDLILSMSKERSIELHDFVENKNKILVVNRTITVEAWLELQKLPKDKKFIIVNDHYSTTIEFTEQLSSMFGNCNLEPYKPYESYADDSSFITPGEGSLIPKKYENIVDVGHRVIDSSTFIEIITKLGIEENIVHRRLIAYIKEIVALGDGIHAKFKELAEKNQILKTLLDNSSSGVAIIDFEGNFKLYNDKFKIYMDIDENEISKGFNYCMTKFKFDRDVAQKIMKETDSIGEVYIRNNRYFNITKTELADNGFEKGFLIVITEITYIKKIEQKLSGKLIQKGQVARYRFEDIITKSENVNKVIELSKKLANSEYEILICGESGTGKELFAQSIHNYSDREGQPFVAVNCAAIPENLLESELFGYEKGAFTGALKDGKKGLFEIAHNGTIFLDEIGDMPLTLQAKLLRVLQEHQISRIGSYEVINVDVRVVAATHRDLKESIKSGSFREDLYYRLNVLPINLPPLRERKEDILLLLDTFLDQKYKFDLKIADLLVNYSWPGNIRELSNVSKYIELMRENKGTLYLEDLPEYITKTKESDIGVKLSNIERDLLLVFWDKYKKNEPTGRQHMIKMMKEQKWSISEMKYRQLIKKLSELGYINIGRGSAGTHISELGIEIIGCL
jgi:transcriptional regulator with PAS, ATPase and Fis domain